jgi:hypothetical protein
MRRWLSRRPGNFVARERRVLKNSCHALSKAGSIFVASQATIYSRSPEFLSLLPQSDCERASERLSAAALTRDARARHSPTHKGTLFTPLLPHGALDFRNGADAAGVSRVLRRLRRAVCMRFMALAGACTRHNERD